MTQHNDYANKVHQIMEHAVGTRMHLFTYLAKLIPTSPHVGVQIHFIQLQLFCPTQGDINTSKSYESLLMNKMSCHTPSKMSPQVGTSAYCSTVKYSCYTTESAILKDRKGFQ